MDWMYVKSCEPWEALMMGIQMTEITTCGYKRKMSVFEKILEYQGEKLNGPFFTSTRTNARPAKRSSDSLAFFLYK